MSCKPACTGPMDVLRALKGSGGIAKNSSSRSSARNLSGNPLFAKKNVRDNLTVGIGPVSAIEANSSVVDQATSWSIGDIVELQRHALAGGTSSPISAFGHVIGAEQGEDGVQKVRVRQLLTATQVPAVLRRTCLICWFAVRWSFRISMPPCVVCSRCMHSRTGARLSLSLGLAVYRSLLRAPSAGGA